MGSLLASKHFPVLVIALVASWSIGGCSGPELELDFSPVKQFDFSWSDVPDAERYLLLESIASPLEVGSRISGRASGMRAAFDDNRRGGSGDEPSSVAEPSACAGLAVSGTAVVAGAGASAKRSVGTSMRGASSTR